MPPRPARPDHRATSGDEAIMVVLGATGGIGSALCQRLIPTGARVVAAGRNAERLAALGQRLCVETEAVDATDVDDVARCVDAVAARHGRVDGVASCVGSLLLKPAHLTSAEEWTSVVDTNLRSAFAVVRASARVMRPTGGSVVLVSSAAARVGLANHEAIAAAKAGVLGLMRASAASYARRGIRVNAVAPGLVETPMTEAITSSARARAKSAAMHALGTLGQPSDVAAMIAWLLDPAQRWVTGQTFGIDGGLATIRAASS